MKRVLAIDGGGIRGLIPAVVCFNLEHLAGCPIHQLFDLIAGSSTGAIIALGLSIAPEGKSAHSLVELYKDDGPHIFEHPRRFMHKLGGPKYSNGKMKDVLAKHFGDSRLSQAIVEVLVTAYDLRMRCPVYFSRSKAKRKAGADYLIRDIAMGTSAAPTYFPPVKVGNHVVIDGGVVANNPACAAYAHAKKLWPDEEILLVSLGTGTLTKFIAQDQAEGWGTYSWARPLIDCVFDGTAKATEDFFRIGQQPRHYWRFQGGLSEVTDTLDGVSEASLAGLEQVAQGIMRGRDREVLDLIESLKKNEGSKLTAQISWPHKEATVPPGPCLVNGSVMDYKNDLLYLFTGKDGRYWPSSRIFSARWAVARRRTSRHACSRGNNHAGRS